MREVSAVVGARRASIMVFDESTGALRTVAARGFGMENLTPVPVEDDCSVAARVFRERRTVVHDPSDPDEVPAGCGDSRGYRGQAFLSVPICYGGAGAPLRCVGVINLTDRIGGDHFTPGDRKLVSAVANQIGAAVENARLVERDLLQQRVRHELDLAHDLQLKLLPSPSVLQGDAEVAARCYPADSVGGDFYTFTRLGRGRVGVMLGDVASHGFSAALVMALVMSAAGIHAAASVTPDETLSALLDSLSTELTETEMYFSVFYGVLDPLTGRLAYANAGHPYAFRVPRFGDPERLETTAPPLGLATAGSIQRRQVPWSVGHDLLVLWTDGLVDARNDVGRGVRRGASARRGLRRRSEPVEAIVNAVLAAAECLRREPGGRPHAPDPEDLTVPRAKRRLGQHFLTDPRILGRIADALEPGPDDTVLEIGPGPGGLTSALVGARRKTGRHREGCRPGAGAPREIPGRGDRRRRRARARLARARGTGIASVTGNIPYNITSPLLDKALLPPRPARIVFLVQKEVADRIAAPRGERLRCAHRGGAGRGAARAALHRFGRRVPAATQGGFGGAPADSAVTAAGERRAPDRSSGGWWWGCSASGGSSCQRGLRELTGWDPDRALARAEGGRARPGGSARDRGPGRAIVALLAALVDGGWSAA